MQPKRRRLVDHPAFPFVFWTLIILFVLAGVWYILAPEFATTYPPIPSSLYHSR